MDMTQAEMIALAQNVAQMLVLFLINYVALSQLVFKPTLKILIARETKIKGLQNKTKDLSVQLENLWQDYQTQLEAAQNSAKKAREDILVAAQNQEREIVARARQNAESQMLTARKTITEQSANAEKELKLKVKEIADDITSKVLGKKAA